MNSNQLQAILPLIVSDVVNRLLQNGKDEDEEILDFANSKVYELLEREETKMWHLSSDMLLKLFHDEKNGSLVLPEV